MKTLTILLLALLIASPACTSERSAESVSSPAGQTQAKTSETAKEFRNVQDQLEMKPVSLTDADKAESTTAAMDRKIIRNADLTMEVTSTTEAQHKVTSIAESRGGFVVTSEAKQRESVDPEKRTLDIKLVVRIPANQFGVALDEIKQLASNLREENVTGQDVTEEFIDLEARIKTQKALELQFLEIMKQASKVADALEVQRQIADVRTEIEKLEGRKRFVENRASLSTITVNIQSPKPIAVSTTGFGRSVRDAVSDSVELASGMVLFFIRFVIVMIPVFTFVLLPLGLILRYLMRRAKRIRLAQGLATPASE